MGFYPNIREETILTMDIVTKSLDKDPNYLDHPDCPYTDVIKAFFRRQTGGNSLEVVDIFEGKDEVEVIDQQIQKVLSDLEAMGDQMKNAETNERLAYFKTKTSLIEKLINMKERVFNLKELSEFRNTLLAAIEDICTKDQITYFLRRLDTLLGTGSQK